MSDRVTVPTAAALDALTAKVSAIDARVTALEGVKPPVPPVPPTPTKTPSPDGFTVTNTTGVLVDSKLRSFTLVGTAANYQISCNGTVSGGNVVKLYAKGGVCYQQNSSLAWWNMPLAATTYTNTDWVSCADPTGVVPPAPPAPPVPPPVTGVPAAAAAVGYTTLTYGPKLILGQNWFPLGNANIRQNADGGITDLGMPQPNGWNAHCSTVQGQSGALVGCAFGGGGYFEIDWEFSGPWPVDMTNGWPAWWATSIETEDFGHSSPGNQGVEYDACEQFGDNTGAYNAGIIIWGNGQMLFSNSGNSCQYGGTGQNGDAHYPSGVDMRSRHKMAWLWVPATATTKGYIKNYFDDKQVGQTYTWNQYAGGTVPNGPGEDTFSIQDVVHQRLWIGGGSVSQITVHTVKVWQHDRSHNLGTITGPTN